MRAVLLVVASAGLLLGCAGSDGSGGDSANITSVTIGSDTVPATDRSSSPDRTESSSTTIPDDDDDSTRPTTTESSSTTTENETTTTLDDEPDDEQEVASVAEAMAVFDATTEDVDPPGPLARSTDDALEALIDGEVVEFEFFDLATSTVPPEFEAIHYLVCDVDALGEACVTTLADYLEFAEACRRAEGELFERLVEEDDGWAGAGVCFIDAREELQAGAPLGPPATAGPTPR